VVVVVGAGGSAVAADRTARGTAEAELAALRARNSETPQQ